MNFKQQQQLLEGSNKSTNYQEYNATDSDLDPLIAAKLSGYSSFSSHRSRHSINSSRSTSPTSKLDLQQTQTQTHSEEEHYDEDEVGEETDTGTDSSANGMSPATSTTVRPAVRLSRERENADASSFRVQPSYGDDPEASYEMYNETHESDHLNSRPVRSLRSLRSIKSAKSQRDSSRFATRTFSADGHAVRSLASDRDRDRSNGDRLHQYYNEQANRIFSEQPARTAADEPINGVSEEIMAVRRSALSVYEPLTYTWLIFSPGFTISAALLMAKWTGLLANVSYWLILVPCWLSHLSLLACHVYAVKSLSKFIAQANINRQRTDSTDHIDRTEYLPLLQRSLKFGIKTGSISFTLFIFEILLYFRLSRGNFSLLTVFSPLWIVALGAILDGIICKTQHPVRVFSWTLVLAFMTLLSLKADYGVYSIPWRMVFAPLIALMGIGIIALTYIVHGHNVGYFRLTDSQYTAGVLYSMGSFLGIILISIFLVEELSKPNSMQMVLLMEALPPLCVALFTLGAYAVSRDEFERLLQYGGQLAVHPMKLSLEKEGWVAVESKGVTWIPMFGEVKYEPLDPRLNNRFLQFCACCACYPYEEEEEQNTNNTSYVGPTPTRSTNVSPTRRIT